MTSEGLRLSPVSMVALAWPQLLGTASHSILSDL